jgi:hypothetical protein
MAEVTVARVQGESFDLETGRAMPKALVLTNGQDEVPVYVEDDTALAVIALARGRQEEPPKKQPKKKKAKASKDPPLAVVDPLEDYRDASTGAPSL